jgi:hypothetical protein
MSALRRLSLCLALAALAAAFLAPAAQAQFGIKDFEVSFTDAEPSEGGQPVFHAGTHPFAMRTTINVNTEGAGGSELPAGGAVEDLTVLLPEGFALDPAAVEPCPSAEFIDVDNGRSGCSDASAVGYVVLKLSSGPEPPGFSSVPVYNLTPPRGTVAKLGFIAPPGLPVTIEGGLEQEPPYRPLARVFNIIQVARFYGSDLTLWGDPLHADHDPYRGSCLGGFGGLADPEELVSEDDCPVTGPRRALITLPRSCDGELRSEIHVGAWNSDATDTETATTPGMSECAAVGFGPETDAALSTERASGPTGMRLLTEIGDPGLTSPEGTADSDVREGVVELPEGVRLNPSAADGLEACSISELAEEDLGSDPGEGCPQASKVGALSARSPLLAETLEGELFVATPEDNLAEDALIGLYMTVKSPERGVLVKLAAEVEPDPRTGQLLATLRDVPQLPVSRFELRLREGGRSPLISPPHCGSYEIGVSLTPHANPGSPFAEASAFEISRGPEGRPPCPPSGTPPFLPGFAAGSLDPAAGAHSPFLMRLTRRDGDQDMTRFDAKLPPGVTGRLAGVPWCPEAAIAAARGRSGADELRDPSCPLAAKIGRTTAGAGVGSQLTYVPGSLYLAGPIGAAPLSVVAITPAVAGPFDVGTVVVRQALKLNPRTAQVEVDGSLSEPIPHILRGIPLALRDLRVYVDRPRFTLNPTSCRPSAVLAGLFGAGSDLFDKADDRAFALAAPFQTAHCGALGFEPRLDLRLKGPTRRGGNPALRAVVRPRPGDANFDRAVVTLPRSAFLDQAHIRTVCTRVQFAAGPGHGALCPPGARYGFARATSPLVDGPVQGPVYLRSSDNQLPDLVIALTGPPTAAVKVELSARIDSVRGGIRSTFAAIPDVPVSRFALAMQGGKKGLIVNSRNLCRKPKRNRARSNLKGQNGKLSRTRPVVRAAGCKGKGRKARRR